MTSESTNLARTIVIISHVKKNHVYDSICKVTGSLSSLSVPVPVISENCGIAAFSLAPIEFGESGHI